MPYLFYKPVVSLRTGPGGLDKRFFIGYKCVCVHGFVHGCVCMAQQLTASIHTYPSLFDEWSRARAHTHTHTLTFYVISAVLGLFASLSPLTEWNS